MQILVKKAFLDCTSSVPPLVVSLTNTFFSPVCHSESCPPASSGKLLNTYSWNACPSFILGQITEMYTPGGSKPLAPGSLTNWKSHLGAFCILADWAIACLACPATEQSSRFLGRLREISATLSPLTCASSIRIIIALEVPTLSLRLILKLERKSFTFRNEFGSHTALKPLLG